MKKVIELIVVVAVLGVGFYFWNMTRTSTTDQIGDGVMCTADAKLCPDGSGVGRTGPQCEFAPCATYAGYKDAAYDIEGRSIKLAGGRAETEIVPDSASKLVTQYFGNEASGDLDGDGISDVAFLLSQSSGGSGTFYYVVVALKKESGYQGLNAVLLGDRIAPQTTEIRNGELIVNYAERKAGEPMTARPSMGVSKYLKVENEHLVEVTH